MMMIISQHPNIDFQVTISIIIIIITQEKKCVYNHCNVEIYSQFATLEIFCNLRISEIQ